MSIHSLLPPRLLRPGGVLINRAFQHVVARDTVLLPVAAIKIGEFGDVDERVGCANAT
jgi:hypothetical protein